MLKTVVKPSSWTCARCVLRQQRLRRTLNTAATAAVSSGKADLDLPLATHSAPGSIHDDQILRQIFDSQPVWREFSQRAGRGVRTRQAGLFQNRYLTSPKGFQDFAGVSLQKCKRIVTKVLAASSIEEYKTVARDLDRLSDLLCRVIDLSDFVRSTHPDPRIQAAATQAYAIMFEYMNVLNTTTGLNDQLKRAVATPEVIEGWTEEEKTVAQILIKDFSKSAIDLPADTRQRFVNLSNEIAELGPEFVDNMAADPPYIMFDNPRMKGMDPVAVKQLTRFGKVILPTIGVAPAQALRTVEDEDVRKQIYIANRTASEKQIKILEQLLTKRAELAKSSGFHSFAEMALVDKLAKSPEAVNEFLQALARDNKSRVNAELAELLALKRASPRIGDTPTVLNAWDKDYYVSKLLALVRSRSRAPDFLSAFFSLGTVMQGLSRLFSRLYGVRLVPRETLPGETWNDDVRRLDVIDEREGHIAVVYCDLFEREGKNPNPAHFTLRCSRRIGEDELAEAAAVDEGLGTPEEIVTDGMASSRNPEGQLYQLPTIALICDFTRNYGKEPTLLHIREVQTLFHEMGHALHSILGRTALQNVAGTRCATDFAELPSILSEHFASAPEVLQLYARHWETDKPLPFQLVQDKLDFDRRVDGMETEAQILLAMLDQAYHSALPLDPSFDSTAVYHDVLNSHGTFAEPPGTRWQGFFGHLFGYGATYYSYLFDRAIAGKVWRDVFQRTPNGAVSREAGAKFREEVLQWGGGRDGWHCLAGVLNDPRLAEGGQEAMAEVGKWGVKAC